MRPQVWQPGNLFNSGTKRLVWRYVPDAKTQNFKPNTKDSFGLRGCTLKPVTFVQSTCGWGLLSDTSDVDGATESYPMWVGPTANTFALVFV